MNCLNGGFDLVPSVVDKACEVSINSSAIVWIQMANERNKLSRRSTLKPQSFQWDQNENLQLDGAPMLLFGISSMPLVLFQIRGPFSHKLKLETAKALLCNKCNRPALLFLYLRVPTLVPILWALRITFPSEIAG